MEEMMENQYKDPFTGRVMTREEYLEYLAMEYVKEATELLDRVREISK